MLNVLVLRICVTSQGHCDTRQLSASSQDFFFFSFFANNPKLSKTEGNALQTHTR